jgi:hypothetical protein
VGDGLALAVASLRDAEFTLDDHDASYADIAEEAMSTYQMDGETGESWMHPKATAMAYSMLLDPPFVIQLIDHLSSDVSTKELLDQKCEAMRREAVPDPGSSCSTNVGKNVVLRACKRLTQAICWTWSCIGPDTNGTITSTLRAPAYEECFRKTFATQLASPTIDAKVIVLLFAMSTMGSLKVFDWSVPSMLARFVECVTPTGIFDGSIFSTFFGMMHFVIPCYALYMAHYQPSRWYEHRELAIITRRLAGIWFMARMICSSSKQDNARINYPRLIVTSIATCVYRLRIERHLFMEIFVEIASFVIEPGTLLALSAQAMKNTLVMKVTCSAIVSLILWRSENMLRRRFAQKFAHERRKRE